jgi:hypothetical protein
MSGTIRLCAALGDPARDAMVSIPQTPEDIRLLNFKIGEASA